jgi:hypothetical protein
MPLVEINPANPFEDGRQSDRALAIRRGVTRHLQEAGVALIAELSLATGRRADLVGLDRKSRVLIVEIKSSIADLRADSKWREYLAFCDYFYFATHTGVPRSLFPPEHGLIVADSYGAEIVRGPQRLTMASATRKALITRFGRAAADRLERIICHYESAGGRLPVDIGSISGD